VLHFPELLTSELKLLQAGGELAETCQCICDLDMPFFHHEVVKKALVTAMEKKNNHGLSLFCVNVLRKE
jgi:programmed cell death protein 4